MKKKNNKNTAIYSHEFAVVWVFILSYSCCAIICLLTVTCLLYHILIRGR